MTFSEHKGISKTLAQNSKISSSVPTQIKVGEFARYLASYLIEYQEEYLKYESDTHLVWIKEPSLAELIQTFQDTLC